MDIQDIRNATAVEIAKTLAAQTGIFLTKKDLESISKLEEIAHKQRRLILRNRWNTEAGQKWAKSAGKLVRNSADADDHSTKLSISTEIALGAVEIKIKEGAIPEVAKTLAEKITRLQGVVVDNSALLEIRESEVSACGESDEDDEQIFSVDDATESALEAFAEIRDLDSYFGEKIPVGYEDVESLIKIAVSELAEERGTVSEITCRKYIFAALRAVLESDPRGKALADEIAKDKSKKIRVLEKPAAWKAISIIVDSLIPDELAQILDFSRLGVAQRYAAIFAAIEGRDIREATKCGDGHAISVIADRGQRAIQAQAKARLQRQGTLARIAMSAAKAGTDAEPISAASQYPVMMPLHTHERQLALFAA